MDKQDLQRFWSISNQALLQATSARWGILTFWRRFRPDWRRAVVNYRARKEQRHYRWVNGR